MAGYDTSQVSPDDAAVTMRSLPRRFRALFAAASPELGPVEDDLAHRIGADGRAAVDHLDLVVRSLALLDRALERVLVEDEPVLHSAVVDEAQRHWDVGDEPVEDLLGELADAAEALADRITRTPAEDWRRPGRSADTDTVLTALDLVREAVRTAVDHLAAIERVLSEGRGRA